jgi:hypothetical protein
VSGQLTRSLVIDDLTPSELATVFVNFGSEKQADFFNQVAIQVEPWGALGWQKQSIWIAEDLTAKGRVIVEDLAAMISEGDKL